MLTAVSKENRPCAEKKRLLTEYDTATSRFYDVVTKFLRDIRALSKDECDRAAQSADEARIRSEEARIELERHVSTHGC